MNKLELSIVNSLVDLGFTQNESKIFLYLIKNPNSNGYEISKNTGISRSMVYSSLEKLKSTGYIDLAKSSSSTYLTKPLSELEFNINHVVDNAIRNLEDAIPKLVPDKTSDVFITIADTENQIKKMLYLVNSAKKYLYISAGAHELKWIRSELKNLSKNVEVHMFSFTDLSEFSDSFNVYSKNMSTASIRTDDTLKDRWRILIIKDRKEMFLCGGVFEKPGTAIYTSNIMLVKFATEHFVHDIKLYNIENECKIDDNTHVIFHEHEKNVNADD